MNNKCGHRIPVANSFRVKNQMFNCPGSILLDMHRGCIALEWADYFSGDDWDA